MAADSWDALLEEQAGQVEPEVAELSCQPGTPEKPSPGRKRGRPAGQGSSLLNAYLGSRYPDAPPLQGIEHARAVKAQKAKERAASAEVARDMGIVVLDRSGAGGDLRWLQRLGEAQVVATTGSKVQNGLLTAARAAEAANVDTEDALIERQLTSSLASVSCKALEEQLQERNIGRRVLAVAAAFLELGSLLWHLFLKFLLSAAQSSRQAALRPVMLLYRLRYDETPTKLRVADPRDPRVDFSTASAAEATKANVIG